VQNQRLCVCLVISAVQDFAHTRCLYLVHGRFDSISLLLLRIVQAVKVDPRDNTSPLCRVDARKQADDVDHTSPTRSANTLFYNSCTTNFASLHSAEYIAVEISAQVRPAALPCPGSTTWERRLSHAFFAGLIAVRSRCWFGAAIQLQFSTG
jgi:hypothetical protein